MGRTPLAWKNVTHNKVRAFASLTGVGFAILLIFMQLGFYDACFRSSTMIFDQLDFDIVLLSPQYVHLRGAGAIPKRRLYQAKSIPGVEKAVPIYIATSSWRDPNPAERDVREIMVIGIDPNENLFELTALRESAELLKEEDSILVDEKSQAGYGKAPVGTFTELEHRRVQVVGTYASGSGFVSDAAVYVGDKTLQRLFPGYPLEEINLGLIKLAPNVNHEEVIADLKAKMPADVQVWKREQLNEHEQRYFVQEKPLGIMFFSGVILALVVGAVILYQVLSSEIMNRLKEYATLKAMGYSNFFMRGVVLQQAAIFALMGYVPAIFLAMGLYKLTNLQTNLPMVMTKERVLLVLVLSLVMCGMSGLLASRKVANTDPADLF